MIRVPHCFTRKCVHFLGILGESEATQKPVCEAFNAGIPKVIAYGDNDHTSPVSGDNGIQFEAKEETNRFAKHLQGQHDQEAHGHGEEGDEEAEEPVKRPAIRRGEAVSARRVGEGKDAKIILEDGSEAPPHIQASKIPPAWENVKVYTDPKSEIWVTATQTTARGKTSTKSVQNPSYEAEMSAAKHVRIEQMIKEESKIESQIKDGLGSDETKDEAAVALLMDRQATRPGSEKDTKGLEQYYGKPVTAENIIVTPGKGKAGPSVSIKVGKEKIPIRDAGAKAQLIARKESGEGLEDTTYWLKSHGATTLEGRHVVEADDGLRLQFMGKEGVWHDHLIGDPELADIIRERAETAGERGGKLFDTNDRKVQDYVSTLDTGRFTPKDFRTKRATLIALEEVKAYATRQPKDEKERNRWILEVSGKAAHVLGNQPKQCFETYINPHIWDVIPRAAA